MAATLRANSTPLTSVILPREAGAIVVRDISLDARRA